ncbi:MAG: hypothetical protein JSV03_11270, partial [Planctomycetota bacterium]
MAILCFIYFYAQFVSSVSAFWGTGLVGERLVLFDYTFWNNFVVALSAIIMYLCGRSLWHKGRFARWWLIGAIIILLGARSVDVLLVERSQFTVDPKEWGWQLVLANLLPSSVFVFLDVLPWIAILILALLYNRSL